MRVTPIAICWLAAAAILAAGCRSNTIDPSELRFALDDYYRLQPHCLWSSPVNFPTGPDNSNPEQVRQLKALAGAGMLERRTGMRGGALVTEFSLSAQGRVYWTADPKEPGWGNFCFGLPEVKSIDSISPPGASVAYTVTYHYAADVPGWAKSPAIQSAFPQVAAEASGVATATLVRAGTVWQVQNVTPTGVTASGE
jgi:hypothetical protein